MTRVLATYQDQDQAQDDIKRRLEKAEWSNLSQALSQAYSGDGKHSVRCEVEDYGMVNVLHASAGKPGTGSSVTVFYFFHEGLFRLIALGEHAGTQGRDPVYLIDKVLGQEEFPFKKGKKVLTDGARSSAAE